MVVAEAAQLEHMIMCQYLYAEFSLKAGREEGLTWNSPMPSIGGAASYAASRWRRCFTFRSWPT